MNKFWSRKRGTSLVEILVVMFVLLVGIMTIIQLFPTGFGIVRDAESRTIATKLAQQELERWKNMSENIPIGIVAINDQGVVINDNDPGPSFKSFLTGGDRGNVLNSRQILGETTSIPVGSYFTTGGGTHYGSRYTLAFSPIETKWENNNYTGIKVKSGDLRRRFGNKEQYPPYLRPGEYAVDYELGDGAEGRVFYVAFPKDTVERLFYVSFSYRIADDSATPAPSELHSAIDQEVLVPANNGEWQEVPIPDPPPGHSIEEIDDNSDSCARGFMAVEDFDSLGDSPYEFYVADTILGIIAFNPKGRGTYEYTARGVRPIEARIDYRIYDSRIIREDKVIPPPKGSATTTPIKLALRFIMNAGDPSVYDDGDPTDNPGEPTFEGLMRKDITQPASTSNIMVSTSILIIDLATGLRVDPDAFINNIDYKAGIVTLPSLAHLVDWEGTPVDLNKPPAADPPPVQLIGRHLRFFYRADGDWSVQCQKAYAIYSRDWGDGPLDYYHYRVEPDANTAGEFTDRLFFAPCERDKSVSVNYTYKTSDGTEHRVVGASRKVSDTTLSITNSDGDVVKLNYIDLEPPEGGRISQNANISVIGTSFRARVIWRDGLHWRHVDMDTHLLRK